MKRKAVASSLETLFLNVWKLHSRGDDMPVAEYKFHPSRRWRFDFAWPDLMLAVEIEGGVKFFRKGQRGEQGRHNQASGFLKDCDKYNEAARLGWRVFRFTNKHLKADPVACVMQVRQSEWV